MQAIQFPANPTLNNLGPASQASATASPARPDCAICSFCCSVPLMVIGGIMAGTAYDSTMPNAYRALYATASASMFALGLAAIIKPIFNELRADQQQQTAPQAAPSPRLELPPINPANHVVVELPDTTLALGVDDQAIAINRF